MKKTTPSTPVPPNENILREIHTKLINFPIHFRERICDECNWSVPTFYRTMRKQDELSEQKKRVIPAISNANADKIITVLDEVSRELREYYRQFVEGKNEGKASKNEE